jgi:uncharacterized protein YciI
LRFSQQKDRVGEFMDGHRAWLTQGFDDGVFLVAGMLQQGQGGAIIAHGESREELEARVADDPFVQGQVVTPEILEIDPARADERLQFLLG